MWEKARINILQTRFKEKSNKHGIKSRQQSDPAERRLCFVSDAVEKNFSGFVKMVIGAAGLVAMGANGGGAGKY